MHQYDGAIADRRSFHDAVIENRGSVPYCCKGAFHRFAHKQGAAFAAQAWHPLPVVARAYAGTPADLQGKCCALIRGLCPALESGILPTFKWFGTSICPGSIV